MTGPVRELTLAEIVANLPVCTSGKDEIRHRAQIEYDDLKRDNAELQEQVDFWRDVAEGEIECPDCTTQKTAAFTTDGVWRRPNAG